ncbi:MAG: HNH endonuclease [Burkholderiales bacterium]
MKTCSKCKQVKPTTGFYKDSSKLDGLEFQCKSCRKIAHSARYAANKDKENERSAKWIAKNQERQKANVAKWKSVNIEVVRVLNQNYRASKRATAGKLSKGLADKLFKLQRGKCACGCEQPLGNDYHMDHIMPLKLGGSNTDDNIQLLRQMCNNQKHAKHPIDFMQSRGFLI